MAQRYKQGEVVTGKGGQTYVFLGGDDRDKANFKPVGMIEAHDITTESAFKPPSEAIRSLATGTLAAPVSGIAGLAGTVVPGEAGQGAQWAETVRNKLIYQPETPEAARILRTVTAPFEWLSEKARATGGAITDVTGSPMAGTATSTALEMAPALIAKGLKGPVARSKGAQELDLAGRTADAMRKNETWTMAKEA